MFEMLSALFGNETAAKVLLYIINYREGYTSGIAKTFDIAKPVVYKQILRLEAAGIIVGRSVGNIRLFSINPRCPFKNQLEIFGEELLGMMPDKESERYFTRRRRPRRTGKKL